MKRTGSIGLTGPAGGDEDAATGQVARPMGAERRLDRCEDLGRLRHPAAAVLAAGGERALAGLDHLDAALAQGRDVGAGRRRLPHPPVHRRGDDPRRGAGEERGRQQRVADPGGQLRDRVRRGGGDDERIGALDDRQVGDRVMRGQLVAGIGAAQRVAARTRRPAPGRR